MESTSSHIHNQVKGDTQMCWIISNPAIVITCKVGPTLMLLVKTEMASHLLNHTTN